MKAKLVLRIVISLLILLILFPQLVYANSSWHWISNYRPIDILPFVVIATLLIEIFMVKRLGDVRNLVLTIIVVSIANIASFVVPYLLFLLPNELGIPSYQYFMMRINNWPTYNVGLMYLILTLVVEVPIVYHLLKKDCDKRKKLLRVVIVANILTTVLVAVVERMISVGQW